MDDFNLSTLHESKSEWAARLLIVLTPLMIEGFRSIFTEANQMCKASEEPDKYLMTFQNLLLNIPKWSNSTVEKERNRIIERSGCKYLEDLVTCVHIVQLKILTAMRVGTKQKKINIDIPKSDVFIHKAYINTARKIYNNVYLYEMDIQPLLIQKNYRELEIIIQECILNTIRESIPVETILSAYMDETIEEEVTEEIKEHVVHDEDIADARQQSLKISNVLPASTNPELTKLRSMQTMLQKENNGEMDRTNAIEVDVTPISRPPTPPVSIENLQLTTTSSSGGDKLIIPFSSQDDDEIKLDFETL